MSHDDTDRLSADPPGPSMRDLVLQLLERTGRVEVALGVGEADTLPLSGRINRLTAELAEFKAEMTEFKGEMLGFKDEVLERLEDIDRELARLSRQDAGRWLRLEERVRVLEHPEEPKG
jgi:hypothetical protein